jgi:uncharacterized caspase-like protein
MSMIIVAEDDFIMSEYLSGILTEKGRSVIAVGLAPAPQHSNLSPAKPGGGVFIAYATDAGAVAADGREGHSPFTQALLRNMQKPI